MPTTPKQDRARASNETAAQVIASNLSCAQSRDHVAASREAIQRSFQLLSHTASPWTEGDALWMP